MCESIIKIAVECFAERCHGGPKNKHFWLSLKSFINSIYHVRGNIILREKCYIVDVDNVKSVAKIFNAFFTEIASNVGCNNPIPGDHVNDDILISLIAK